MKLAILSSGRGSNMQALVEAAQPAGVQIVLVAANRQAAGIDWAKQKGIPTVIHPVSAFNNRSEQEQTLAASIEAAGAELVFLAGYMAILSADFVARFAGKIINIHPSLLPDYKGLDTHQRALDDGRTQHGASVHLVTAALDDGPVLLQAVVDILDGDNAETLATRTLSAEHILYPTVLNALAVGDIQLHDTDFTWDQEALRALMKTYPQLRLSN